MIPGHSEEFERVWLDYMAANKRAAEVYEAATTEPPPCSCGKRKPRKETACATCRRSQETKK